MKGRPCPDSAGKPRPGGIGRTPLIPGGAGIPPGPLKPRSWLSIPELGEYICKSAGRGRPPIAGRPGGLAGNPPKPGKPGGLVRPRGDRGVDG